MPPPTSLLFFLLSVINCSVLLKINSDPPIYWGHGSSPLFDNSPHYFHTKTANKASIHSPVGISTQNTSACVKCRVIDMHHY